MQSRPTTLAKLVNVDHLVSPVSFESVKLSRDARQSGEKGNAVLTTNADVSTEGGSLAMEKGFRMPSLPVIAVIVKDLPSLVL